MKMQRSSSVLMDFVIIQFPGRGWCVWRKVVNFVHFVTDRNEVVDKVMFLLVSVILSTGGGSASVHAEMPQPPGSKHPPGSRHPPGIRHPPGSRHPPEQTPPQKQTPQEQTPPGIRHPPKKQTPPWEADIPPPTSMLGDPVNARAVRILLECNLVFLCKQFSLLPHSNFSENNKICKVAIFVQLDFSY